MNFNLNQQDVLSKISMEMKMEVNRNCVYLTPGERFGFGAFLVEVRS